MIHLLSCSMQIYHFLPFLGGKTHKVNVQIQCLGCKCNLYVPTEIYEEDILHLHQRSLLHLPISSRPPPKKQAKSLRKMSSLWVLVWKKLLTVTADGVGEGGRAVSTHSFFSGTTLDWSDICKNKTVSVKKRHKHRHNFLAMSFSTIVKRAVGDVQRNGGS